MDISKLPIKPPKRVQTTHPRDIFKSLTLRGSVQNVWGPQAEALEAWHKDRPRQDIVIGLSTGGGKTLVGLLIAQSLVNETHGKVIYACPTKQLVDQAAEKARDCGIDVAVYMAGTWQNVQAYDRSVGFCITNYAAVFNSRSIFRDHEIAGLVFDDAHVASNFVRSQFSLDIANTHQAFIDIANLFRPHFYRSSQTQEFEDMLRGDRLALLFAPMFEVRRQADAMRRFLAQKGVAENPKTSFPWEYLKDRLGRCVVLLSGSGIQITPPVLPVQSLPYFRRDVRRIYLTATLPTHVEFLRTFGVSCPLRITPGGKSGEAQRLFVFMPGASDDEQRQAALTLAEAHKACIITSSDHAANAWCPPAAKFSGTHAAVQAFARSSRPEKLVMAARYDGVDLPGDACRILILSGLPTGSSLFERFIDQGLRIERLRSSHLAVRITQAIGRIFRGNTDHGAVLVCGRELQRWLSNPQNQRYMPRLLQQQVNFGLELRRMVDEGHTTFEELLRGVLDGTKEWDALYSAHVEAFETQEQPSEPEWFVNSVLGEVEAFGHLWDGNWAEAAAGYASIADAAEKEDQRLSAWFRHWEGLANDYAKNHDAALRAYVRAANARSELGRPATKHGVVTGGASVAPSIQARRISDVLKKKGPQVSAHIKAIEKGFADPSKTNSVEQALRDLGAILGLESSRPERQTGSGPDVLWRYPSARSGAALEAKTNKKPTSEYTKKDDIGQFHDHIGWLEDNHPGETFLKAIVGPKLPVSRESHPPEDLRIIPLEQFVALAARAKDLLQVAAAMAEEDEKLVTIERSLQDMGLSWPNCIDSLESYIAEDLKSGNDLADEVA